MDGAPRRLSRPLVAAGAGVILFAGAAVWLWTERAPIAASFIDDALRAKGIPARYRLTQIGFRKHRIEGIRIGDPSNPDLIADWAEIELLLSPFGVSVRAIDAGGVRLSGRLVDGKLSLGAIDRLLPAPNPGQPFTLPDIDLTARSIRFDVALPQGLIRATLDGSGNLHEDFKGRLSIVSDYLKAGGCGMSTPRAQLAVRVDGGRPRVMGPIEAAKVACAGASIGAPRIDIDARGNEELARWSGAAIVKRGHLAARGLTIDRLGGDLRFDGSTDKLFGTANLFAEQFRYGSASVGRASLIGAYRFMPGSDSFAMDGDVRLVGARADPAMADSLAAQLSAAGTPVGPILAAWGSAVRQAARNVDATARFTVSSGPDGGVARIERIEAHAEGGGHLLVRAEQAEGLGWHWPLAEPVLNASVELSGGNLPQLLMSLRQPAPGAPWTGSATMAPYDAQRARLRLAPIEFGPGADGATRVSTRVMVDGPLADGRVEELALPISASIGAHGAFTVNNSCAPLSFERLVITGTKITHASLPLCPVSGALVGRSAAGRFYGGARIATPRLRGRIGDQPLTMMARALAVTIGRPGFRLDDLRVRLGDSVNPSRLDVAVLEGVVGRPGLGGHFDGAAGKIGAVPLLISGGAGDWGLASSVLSIDGAIRLGDAEQVSPRFHPLLVNDVHMTVKGGRIAATGMLREPRSAASVAGVSLRHDLSSGAGDAILDVESLRFAQGGLQPEAITPLTLGMIANVDGRLTGQGRIGWKDGNVVSDGEFSTQGINLAAAFGPVTGLKGTIRFTDLLGLVTAPGQQITIAEINPGIAVTNGIVRYRILPDHKLAIAGGEWPFSGGTLTLEPGVLDMVEPVARRLTFRISGLDAATFVQQLEFKNITVTGKFDGVLPIVFDSRGGRIENGELTVRPEGGTLSYVGDVTNANLGRIARIAFDALKSMRYRRLTIELNGDLDGEIISRVRFDGTNNQSGKNTERGGVVGHLLAPITRLPFRFNIVITAPFRGLVNSAQTFVDPSIVLRNTAAGAVPVSPAGSTAPNPSPIQPR